MLKVMFVEDDEDAIRPIKRLIREEEPEIELYLFGFDEAESNIRSLRPDIVVLDLWEGPLSENVNTGSEHLGFIWNQQFCPVIIHSASPDKRPEYSNSFVEVITKGQNSPEQVLNAIRDFLPHVQALNGAEEHIRNSLSIVMRDVAPSSFEFHTNVEERDEAILRAGRRRLAALMDEISAEGRKLVSWEQYICPPISKNVLLGDVLRKSDGKCNDPASFRVVLTPSCDLVIDRNSKVSHVLVAKCRSTKSGFDLTSWKGISTRKLEERLRDTVLSRGYFETIVPLPELQGRIPTMMANLRELELIPLDDIGLTDKQFLRIASLDSPFRELVSWAYIQVSGRPGVPDRDLESWSVEIMEAYRNEA